MKNIVICCDGTRGKYGADEKNTNVVRLFERLNSDGEHQISYYDPGVGTYNPQRNRIKRWIRAGTESAFGEGVRKNIAEAYKYLMDHYEQGDRVFLFGYSRGAYTARALAGLLHKCGLLTRGSDNLIPYAMEIYQAGTPQRIEGLLPVSSAACPVTAGHTLSAFGTQLLLWAGCGNADTSAMPGSTKA